jgi:hypothetical protein
LISEPESRSTSSIAISVKSYLQPRGAEALNSGQGDRNAESSRRGEKIFPVRAAGRCSGLI